MKSFFNLITLLCVFFIMFVYYFCPLKGYSSNLFTNIDILSI